MARNEVLFPLQEALADLVTWLEGARVPHVLIGGLAVAFLGRPRVTRDIDVLASLDEEAWGDFLDAGRPRGFAPRISDCVEFARTSRVLLVRHEPTSVDVDLVLAGLAFEKQVIDQARRSDVGGIGIRLPRPEDLVIMKAVAQRPRDIADIEAILDSQTSLDWEHIMRFGREFAEALANSDIIRTLESFRRTHEAGTG